MPENAMLKDIAAKIVTSLTEREAVTYLRVAYEGSKRRARSTLRAGPPFVQTMSDRLLRPRIGEWDKELGSVSTNGKMVSPCVALTASLFLATRLLKI
jgi:hypothetical protein